MSQCFHTLDKFLGNRTGTALRSHRLYIDRSGAAGELIAAELPLQIFQIIGEEFVRVLEHKIRNALTHHALGTGNTHAVGQLIRPAVVGTAHFQNILFAGFQTGNTGSTHTGLSAGAKHTELFYGRYHLRDLLGQLILILME